MASCHCDGTQHPWRPDYCPSQASHDPDAAIERARTQRRAANRPYVVNPEAIGDPSRTPILQHSVSGCPAHCEDWLYRAVRTNRHLDGLPPQPCTCGRGEARP